MPIVSEHPRAIDVIQRLSEDCDSELQAFITGYTERRRAHDASLRGPARSAESRREAEMDCRELLALLEAREIRAEELREELLAMSRELCLLKRQLRRARRQALELPAEPEARVQAATPAAEEIEFEAGVPGLPSIQEHITRARRSAPDSFAWLKPWLRGFLPGSA